MLVRGATAAFDPGLASETSFDIIISGRSFWSYASLKLSESAS